MPSVLSASQLPADGALIARGFCEQEGIYFMGDLPEYSALMSLLKVTGREGFMANLTTKSGLVFEQRTDRFILRFFFVKIRNQMAGREATWLPFQYGFSW